MDDQDALLSLAADLTASLGSRDRFSRLVDTVRRAVPCDAAAVFERDGDDLVPVATFGLAPEVLGRRFPRSEHPRLDVALSRGTPVRFPADSALPDPFDGMMADDPHALGVVHSCLGCPLLEGESVVGLLTADALQPGAFDALEDRFLRMLGALAGAALRTARLFEELERASEHHERVARELQRDAASAVRGQIVGTSEAIERVRQEIELVGPTRFAVLITGETGVGKDLVARGIHERSDRRGQPLIQLNCAALPESIVESELFGHVRGAFTGATNDRAGKFEVADGGSLFLDEVGELPLAVQPKLLRALQTGEVQRVGSDRPVRVDVRVLAATNRDLAREVEAGHFRADLFHRLAMYPIHVPPLRERREDIPLLAGYFLDVYRRSLGLGAVRLSDRARRALVTALWPGNVRELDHVLGRAVLRASATAGRAGPVAVRTQHLHLEDARREPPEPPDDPVAPAVAALEGRPLPEAVDDFKRAAIRRAVAAAGGNWAAAARTLGMARGNLHHMARRLGVLGER